MKNLATTASTAIFTTVFALNFRRVRVNEPLRKANDADSRTKAGINKSLFLPIYGPTRVLADGIVVTNGDCVIRTIQLEIRVIFFNACNLPQQEGHVMHYCKMNLLQIFET
jgi:hypothetical protein